MWKLFSGLFLGWSLGANDAANVFGPGVTTATVGYRTAVVLTAVFVVLGAVLEGPKCMATVGELSRLTPVDAFWCTLAAGLTMCALTVLALPASSSQAIVGAVLGAGAIYGTADVAVLFKIVLCWVLTPIGGALAAFLLYSVLRVGLNRLVPSLTVRNTLYTLGILVSGCYAAYCLGGNNVANVTGAYVGSGLLTVGTASLLGGLSIAAGALTYSKKVMLTVGRGIAPLDPFSAVVALLAEALTLHVFTQIGVPVSSSQAVVGAVAGVGLVVNLRTVQPRMLAKIAVGWIVTPLFAAAAAYLFLRLFA